MCILQCGAYNKSIDTHTHNVQKTEKHRKKNITVSLNARNGKKVSTMVDAVRCVSCR